MTFTDSFETPIAIEFEGKVYHLEKLKGRDYLGWCADLQLAYQERNLPLLSDDLKPMERMQHKSSIMGREFTPDDCQGPASTPKGSERIINTAFVRAITSKRLEKSPNDTDVIEALKVADRFIDTLEWPDLQALGLRLSGLFSEQFLRDWFGRGNPQTEDKPKDKPLPNVGAASAAENNPAMVIGKSAA